MPGDVFDRVCETSTTTGTGNFTLAGAIPGYRTFDYVVSGTYQFYYLIEAVDGSGVATGQWEQGLGYMAAATVMERQVVLDSSNAGAVINFSAGTKRVHLVAPAYQVRGISYTAARSTDLTGQNYTTSTAIPWNAAGLDTSSTFSGLLAPFHDTVTNNTRITIPASFRCFCRFTGQVSLANITASEWVELKIQVNGSGGVYGRSVFATPSTTPTYQVHTPVIELNAAAYVELKMQVQADTSVDIIAAESFFQIEIVQ